MQKTKRNLNQVAAWISNGEQCRSIENHAAPIRAGWFEAIVGSGSCAS